MTPEQAKAAGRAIGANVGDPTMTVTDCEARQYAHNPRMRFTTGFYCEDCGLWVPIEDERWYFTNAYGRRQER